MSMSSWARFYERHSKAHYTPVFNTFLDAQIADVNLDLLVRVLAWVLRNSWGRHSDGVIDAEGMRQSQIDCARALSVLDKEGNPDRRKINPIFQELERMNLIRFEGRDIFPIDDPLSSPPVRQLSERGPTISEEKANNTLDYFIEQVWRVRNPKAFEEYQKVETRFKAVKDEYNGLRIKLLGEFKAYGQKDDSEMSERGPTSEEKSRPGVRHDVGKGSDKRSGRGPTSPEPILNNSLNGKQLNTVSSSSAQSEKTSEPEEDHEIGFRGLLHAAEWAAMGVPEGHLPRIRQLWAKLTAADRRGAIEGIRIRKDAGQYGNPKFTPRLLKYLEDRLWTETVREQGQDNRSSYLDQVIDGSGKINPEKNDNGSYLHQLINGSGTNGD